MASAFKRTGERGITVTYRTTVGWSLITSGILTLALTVLPYPSFYWGIGFLALGLLVFVPRQIF
ncbi:hypothetical protein DMJ13_10360 [halophilic archaeon]|nr:hypothetical protein DMJ13_10360 [halophilic archaeon]